MNGRKPDTTPLPQIVIADDDPSVRFLLKHILEKEHYTTLDASNGEEAIKLLDEHHIDMLLIDAIMPELNGFETCKIVKKKFPELPVIIITSLDDDASVEEAYNAGADDYITKPINWSVLKHRLSRARKNSEKNIAKISPELANDIETGRYTISNRLRIDINNESAKSIITYHNQKSHKNHRLLDSNITLQLRHARQLIEDCCTAFENCKTVNKLSIFIHPFNANPVQYINMLRDILKSRNIKNELVECVFSEAQLCNINMIHLYNALSELNVNLHINKFSFSLHTLNLAQNSRCDAIEIDIPLVYKTLKNENLIIDMLSEYKTHGINIFGADISSAEELDFSKQIGCSEIHGPGLVQTAI